MKKVTNVEIIKDPNPKKLRASFKDEVERTVLDEGNDKRLIVVSHHIKMNFLHNLVKGDAYWNLNIDVIHPTDETVKSLYKGKVINYSFNEWLELNSESNAKNTKLLFDSPNLIVNEKVANALRDSSINDEVVISVLSGKQKFAYKALFPFTVSGGLN